MRIYVGVASTVVGLVCYALSSSFNRLYGDWNSFKICAYIVSSYIICLAILFPKAWQHLSIFEYRAHMTFLVLASTTVYSFYLDKKMNTKPDAYGPISSAAFAMTSLCVSKEVECGFVDLLYFFCGVLITQLMQITPLLGFVGTGFSYFLVILRSYLDAPPNRSQSQPPPEMVIDMASLLQSSALDARPREEEEGSNQNQAAIAPVYSFAALRSASLRYRSSTSRASSLRSRPSRPASRRSRPSRPASRRSRIWRIKAVDIHQNQAITRPATIIDIASPQSISSRASSLDFTPLAASFQKYDANTSLEGLNLAIRNLRVLSDFKFVSARFGGDWIRKNRAGFREIVERYQTSSWNEVLKPMELDTSSKSLLRSFNIHFKDKCSVYSKWIVSGRRLRDDLRTSLANKLLPTYENFIHRFKNAFGGQASRYIEYEVPDIQAELGHWFGGTSGIDQPLREKGMKRKLE